MKVFLCSFCHFRTDSYYGVFVHKTIVNIKPMPFIPTNPTSKIKQRQISIICSMVLPPLGGIWPRLSLDANTMLKTNDVTNFGSEVYGDSLPGNMDTDRLDCHNTPSSLATSWELRSVMNSMFVVREKTGPTLLDASFLGLVKVWKETFLWLKNRKLSRVCAKPV